MRRASAPSPGSPSPIGPEPSRRRRATRIHGAGSAPTLPVWSLASRGRDQGNLRFESETASLHVRTYLRLLEDWLGIQVKLRLTLPALGGREISSRLEPALTGPLASEFPQVRWGWEYPTPEGWAYYRTFRFQIHAQHPVPRERNLDDGGGLDWTQNLIQNAKDGLVTSGVGSERFLELFPRKPPDRANPLPEEETLEC